jgi:hypothetical protein
MTLAKWLAVCGAVLVAAIVVASLVPAGWQVRLGLHWLVEHFLAYFAVTAIFCLAWPRPMVVAAVLIPFAVLLEALQGLTPDRVADFPTALLPPPAWHRRRCWPISPSPCGRGPGAAPPRCGKPKEAARWRGLSKCDVSLSHGKL